jgi:hypothetical protein
VKTYLKFPPFTARIGQSGHAYALLCSIAVLIGFTGSLDAQNSSGLLSLRLEQQQGDIVKTVPQKTVFKTGNILRFRVTSQIAGYLYIVDKGTTGETESLYPALDTPEGSNRIEPGQSMVVPANGDGWFEVSGPSGFDVIYILVSATPISIPPAAPSTGQSPLSPQTQAPLLPSLLPRCDDQIFKARGECIDASAGIAPLPSDAPVPRELVPFAKTAARDIVLADDGDGVTIKAAPTAKLPLIYTFRLAHLQ